MYIKTGEGDEAPPVLLCQRWWVSGHTFIHQSCRGSKPKPGWNQIKSKLFCVLHWQKRRKKTAWDVYMHRLLWKVQIFLCLWGEGDDGAGGSEPRRFRSFILLDKDETFTKSSDLVNDLHGKKFKICLPRKKNIKKKTDADAPVSSSDAPVAAEEWRKSFRKKIILAIEETRSNINIVKVQELIFVFAFDFTSSS